MNWCRTLAPELLTKDHQDTMDSPNNWKTFCRLALVALKNPAQTVRLLDIKRLKNLYITLFKQSSYVQENIFDYYLKLYGENTNDYVREVLADINQKLLERCTVLSTELLQVENPHVSVIIPVCNQWEYTERCIRSILHSAEGHDYEIVLADDHSTDETINAAKVFPGIRIVKTAKNCGFLLNCNNAARQARGIYLVFLNNDTVVHKNWLQAMLEIMEDRPEVGMTGSKFMYPDGKLQEAGGIVFSDGSAWNYGRGDDPEKPEYNYVKEVDYVSGACFLVRKSLWDSIGGFDERYSPAYYEDTDLAFEIRKRGYKVVFQPQSLVVHFEGISCGIDETTGGIKQYQAINREQFAEKWKKGLKENHFENSSYLFQARERSKNKTTILVIDNQVPLYDEDAGSKSTFQYLQWFVGRGFNVKFIADDFYRQEPSTTVLQQLGIEVLYGPWYAKNWKKWLWDNGVVFDYVYIHRPQIAAKYIDIVRKTTKAKIIFFGHDLHYLRTQRQYEVEKNEKLIGMAEVWRKKEFSIFSKADLIYYPSETEVKEVKKHFPSVCVKSIPLYIYEKIAPIIPQLETRKDIFFVGGFQHEPNLDGVFWFLREVLPHIRNKLPDVKFLVAGSKMPVSLMKINFDHVVILGEISRNDLERYYTQCRVFVAPLRYGAGIKGKILEALSFQLPVVTTEVGAEGLPDADKFMKIADNPEEFANQVVTIYEDKKLWQELAESGRIFLTQHYSIERVSEILAEDFRIIPKNR